MTKLRDLWALGGPESDAGAQSSFKVRTTKGHPEPTTSFFDFDGKPDVEGGACKREVRFEGRIFRGLEDEPIDTAAIDPSSQGGFDEPGIAADEFILVLATT